MFERRQHVESFQELRLFGSAACFTKPFDGNSRTIPQDSFVSRREAASSEQIHFREILSSGLNLFQVESKALDNLLIKDAEIPIV